MALANLIPNVTNDFFGEVALGDIEFRHVAAILGHRGHKQLIVRVKTAWYHAGQEDKPHHELLVGAVLADIGQDQVEIDHRHDA